MTVRSGTCGSKSTTFPTMRVRMEYYRAFHDIVGEGTVTEISIPFKYLKLDGEKVLFEDIYKIEIIDMF